MFLLEIKELLVNNWKKIVIAIAVVIISNAATGLGCYCAGTKTCKSATIPIIQEKKSSTEIFKPKEKNIVCGDQILLSTKMITKNQLQIVAADQCKRTTNYYDFNYNCPNPKWSIFIAPGFLLGYDLQGKKIYPMIGGGAGFQRHWGNFSLGPELLVYSMIDKSYIAVGCNLRLEYRF